MNHNRAKPKFSGDPCRISGWFMVTVNSAKPRLSGEPCRKTMMVEGDPKHYKTPVNKL